MPLPSETNTVILQNPPLKEVKLEFGQADSTFKLITSKLDASIIKEGELVVRVLYLSNDPTQRGWIQKGLNPKRMYVKPVLQGDPMKSMGIGEVVYSKSSKFQEGDILNGSLYWADYAIIDESAVINKINPRKGLPLELYLGPLGGTGLTAYFGLKDIGKIKEGQTVVISAASGATGCMAVQLAKHVFKAGKVIGITGSKANGDWVKSLGADIVVNYKDTDFRKQLAKAIGPDFADIYFDGVGGDILSFMLTQMKPFGRVVACGAIAGYNDFTKQFVKTWSEIITNRLTVQGFIVLDYVDRFGEGTDVLANAIAEGKVKIDSGVDLRDISKSSTRFQDIPQVWNTLFTGKGAGKLVTKL
ncbi:uncharacterized protein KQ657_001031 [Scheffersomyces spartinae]|uniref:Enoyl reductase (ER) domain-containing protein n=1 Tax=Scheffersomyces spartinae TaxID=45513 RepID=A0A9P7V9E1_9ASCO|nr:uncharacterized protein KQ657_001031 [Scheffersomyces spartinae]KAG7193268.1 hypothetical protein KQ657_001031 [Scheffersomyces spartinae]